MRYELKAKAVVDLSGASGDRIEIAFKDVPPWTYFQHDGQIYLNCDNRYQAYNLSHGWLIAFNPTRPVYVIPVEQFTISKVTYGMSAEDARKALESMAKK